MNTILTEKSDTSNIGDRFKNELISEAYNLGLIIKNLRKSAGLSQSDFAMLIKKDRSYVSKVELSTISPKFEVLQNIALIFNLKTYELLIKAHLENGMPTVTPDISIKQAKKISNWIDEQIEFYDKDKKGRKLLKISPN